MNFKEFIEHELNIPKAAAMKKMHSKEEQIPKNRPIKITTLKPKPKVVNPKVKLQYKLNERRESK